MDKKQMRNTLLLVGAAFIWGTAFVAQSVGSGYVGPYTFLASRSWLACVFLLGLMAVLRKMGKTNSAAQGFWQNKPVLIKGGICCGVALFAASAAQQMGIGTTSTAKAGFMTALYVVLVPVFGLFFKRKVNLPTWIAVVLSVIALYLLCIKGDFSLAPGDLLILVCAVCFAIHILVIDHFTATVDGLKLSCVQFLVAAVWATLAKVVCAILGVNGIGDVSVATSIFAVPDWQGILSCFLPILYVGVFSSGVAYTLQILAQKDSNPTVVTILLSLESVFAVISGAIILHQQMTAREYIGCVIMFAAVILAQIPNPFEKKA